MGFGNTNSQAALLSARLARKAIATLDDTEKIAIVKEILEHLQDDDPQFAKDFLGNFGMYSLNKSAIQFGHKTMN